MAVVEPKYPFRIDFLPDCDPIAEAHRIELAADAYLGSSQNSSNNFDPPPILIAGDTPSACSRARLTVAMAGWRLAETVQIENAAQRLGRQGSTSALWIELDEDLGPAAEALLARIAEDVEDSRYGAVVAIPSELLDRVAAYAFRPGMDVIVDAGDADRAAALTMALSGANRPNEIVLDMTADRNAARLRQLSDEVSRIATTLARLSTGPAALNRTIEVEPHTDSPEVSPETVRSIIRARRLRSRYFAEDLFADPAWDMLLDLLQAEISKLRVPVSSLCIAASVPATTALRWLKTMVQEGLFLRHADPHDGRRVFVELAPHTSQALRRYFADIGPIAVV